MEIKEIVAAQRAYFNSGKTLPVQARTAALERLRETVVQYRDRILTENVWNWRKSII